MRNLLDQLTNRQLAAVMRLNRLPMTSPQLEDALQAELPGQDLAVFLEHIGGGGLQPTVRIESVRLPGVRMGAPIDCLVALDVDEADFEDYRDQQAERRAVERGVA